MKNELMYDKKRFQVLEDELQHLFDYFRQIQDEMSPEENEKLSLEIYEKIREKIEIIERKALKKLEQWYVKHSTT